MDDSVKKDILEKAKIWMREELVRAHKANTLKLASLKEFNINPFLWAYLAYYLRGNNDYRTLAEVLIYPRVLGSSITTSFGARAQDLITRLFEGTYGSGIPGIDIEFTDKLDGRKKYCQIKAGPNVINRDDVKTIRDHFRALQSLARTNHLSLQTTDMMFCLLYGEENEKNGFVLEVERDYVVSMGRDFWHRFTGDPDFYKDLIAAFGEVAQEINMRKEIESTIDDLSRNIEKTFGDIVH